MPVLNFHGYFIESCLDLGISGRGILSEYYLLVSLFNVMHLWQRLRLRLSVNFGRLDLQSAWSFLLLLFLRTVK